MSSINKVILIGRLGQNPEIRQFQNGGQVANLSIATSEKWTDKQTGQPQERTEWHRVVLFNRLAEIAGQHLTKGSLVYIEGSLTTEKYTDNQGIERTATKIKGNELRMLGGNNGNGQSNNNQAYGNQSYQQGYGNQSQGQGYGQGYQGQAPQGYPNQAQSQGYQGQYHPQKGNPVGTRYATNADGKPIYPPQPLPPEQQKQGWANHQSQASQGQIVDEEMPF